MKLSYLSSQKVTNAQIQSEIEKKVLFDQNFSMISHFCPVKNIESGLSLFWLQYFYARKKIWLILFYSAGVVLIFFYIALACLFVLTIGWLALHLLLLFCIKIRSCF